LNTCSLQFQLCIYPFFDGGFFLTIGKGPLNRMIRLGMGFADFRIWWDDRRHFIPFDCYPDDAGLPRQENYAGETGSDRPPRDG
jgi:hypothetical protein